MKKNLLALAILAFAGIAKISAQCNIAQSSIIVNIKSVVSNPGGGCTTIFDLTYDITNNGGNKWSYIHLWDATAYPALTYTNGTGPNMSQLNGGAGSPKPMLSSVAINYAAGIPAISLIYGPDAAVVPQASGISVTRTAAGSNERFFIQNIKVTTSHCNPLNLTADVWSAQDNNGKNIGCGVTGLSIRADEPMLRGFLMCSNPRAYTVSIQTKSTRNVTFTAYKDVTPFGVFDVNDQAIIVDGPRTITNNGDPNGIIYNTFGSFPLIGGSTPGNRFDVWVVATAAGITNNNAILVTNSCISLPVEFVSFTAERNHSTVALNWQTAAEQNSAGFAIERNISGSWQQTGYVASLATAGNSNSILSYQYTDMNNIKGITQYRIKQIDLDGKFKYSAVRSVRSEGQTTQVIVYPNPSKDGKINVSFGTSQDVIRDVILVDMSGRVIRQWKGITGTSLQIDNVNSGIYTLRVSVAATGEQSVEKVVVNRQ